MLFCLLSLRNRIKNRMVAWEVTGNFQWEFYFLKSLRQVHANILSFYTDWSKNCVVSAAFELARSAKTNLWANEGSRRSERGKVEKVSRLQAAPAWPVQNRKAGSEIQSATSYPISLEVDENPSGDLGDQDEQQARKVLEVKKNRRWVKGVRVSFIYKNKTKITVQMKLTLNWQMTFSKHVHSNKKCQAVATVWNTN